MDTYIYIYYINIIYIYYIIYIHVHKCIIEGKAQTLSLHLPSDFQDVHEAQLEQLFRSIGPITDLHLMRTADGKSRGMGHVTYQIHGE